MVVMEAIKTICGISAFRTMLLLDSVVNLANFVRQYVVYYVILKTRGTNILVEKLKFDFNGNLMQLYSMNVMQRMLVYTCVGCVIDWEAKQMCSADVVVSYVPIIIMMCGYTIALPHIQNRLYKVTMTNSLFPSSVYYRFIVSKGAISMLRKIEGVEQIPNYSIFTLYHVLDESSVINIVKFILVFMILDVLRGKKSVSHYYTVASVGFYYYTGHSFSIISREHAKKLLNKVISSNQWNDIVSPNALNAVYCVLKSAYEPELLTDGIVYLGVIFCYVYCVSYMSIGARVCVLSGMYVVNGVYGVDREDMWVVLLCVNLCLWTHEILCVWICVLALVGYRWVGQVLRDTIFFGQHYNDILKMVEYTGRKKQRKNKDLE